MKVLAIDTSSYANIVSVIDGEHLLANTTYEARSDSLEKIISNISETLDEAGLTLEDIDGIGVGLGPGSWTGIRVGVTAGKMLAYAAGKPVCGIPTIDALAYAAINGSPVICPVISAGTGDAVYAALYQPENGFIKRSSEYYVGNISGLADFIKGDANLVGHQIDSWRIRLEKTLSQKGSNVKFTEANLQGAAIARLAARRFESNDKDDVLALTPLYLKESTARVFVPGKTKR